MISNVKRKLKKLVSPRASRSDKQSKLKDNQGNAKSTVKNALSQSSSKSSDQSAENSKRRDSLAVGNIESPRRIDDCSLDALFAEFENEHKTLDYSDLLKSFPWIVRLDYKNIPPDVLSAFMNDKNNAWGDAMGMVPKRDARHYSPKGCAMLNRVGRHQFYEKFNEIARSRPDFDASGRLEANSKTNKIIQSFITSVANEIRTLGFRTRWKGADDARDAIQNFDMAANRHQQFGAKDWSDLCHAIENLDEFKQWNNRAGSPENRALKSPRKMPQVVKTMTISPRKVAEKKPSAAFCRDFVSLINAHDPGRPDLIKFIVDELARNSDRAGLSTDEETAFQELTNVIQDDSKEFDQCWKNFRGIMESNSEIKRYRTKNKVVTASKPTKLAGESTSLSGKFRADFNNLLEAHGRIPDDDGSPYIPGKNGFPYLRDFINAERRRNPDLKGWFGREFKAFSNLEKALEGNDEEAATTAWVSFREVMVTHLDMQQKSNRSKNGNQKSESIEVKKLKLDGQRFHYRFDPGSYEAKEFLEASMNNHIQDTMDFDDAMVKVKDDVKLFKNGLISNNDIFNILESMRKFYEASVNS